jgi:hypothetical protein
MMRKPLDPETATRLLSGSVHPDDAPPGFAGVAALLNAAASLAAGPDKAAAAPTVAAMVEAIRAQEPVSLRPSRRRMAARVLSVKVAAAVSTLALATGGAAAATGSLPDSIQEAVAEAVSHVGIDLPSADNEHANVGGRSGASQGKAGEPHGKAGKLHGGKATPEDAGQGHTISEMTHDPALEGEPKGPVVSPVASDGHSQAGSTEPPATPAGSPAAPADPPVTSADPVDPVAPPAGDALAPEETPGAKGRAKAAEARASAGATGRGKSHQA